MTEELQIVLPDTVHRTAGPVKPVDVPHHLGPVRAEQSLVDGPRVGADHQPQPPGAVLKPPSLVDRLQLLAVTEVAVASHQAVDPPQQVLGRLVDERRPGGEVGLGDANTVVLGHSGLGTGPVVGCSALQQ